MGPSRGASEPSTHTTHLAVLSNCPNPFPITLTPNTGSFSNTGNSYIPTQKRGIRHDPPRGYRREKQEGKSATGLSATVVVSREKKFGHRN